MSESAFSYNLSGSPIVSVSHPVALQSPWSHHCKFQVPPWAPSASHDYLWISTYQWTLSKREVVLYRSLTSPGILYFSYTDRSYCWNSSPCFQLYCHLDDQCCRWQRRAWCLWSYDLSQVRWPLFLPRQPWTHDSSRCRRWSVEHFRLASWHLQARTFLCIPLWSHPDLPVRRGLSLPWSRLN